MTIDSKNNTAATDHNSQPFAYSIKRGMVSRITPVEQIYNRFSILSLHCLTQAQIQKIGGVK